jgi:hypothetical protein
MESPEKVNKFPLQIYKYFRKWFHSTIDIIYMSSLDIWLDYISYLKLPMLP